MAEMFAGNQRSQRALATLIESADHEPRSPDRAVEKKLCNAGSSASR